MSNYVHIDKVQSFCLIRLIGFLSSILILCKCVDGSYFDRFITLGWTTYSSWKARRGERDRGRRFNGLSDPRASVGMFKFNRRSPPRLHTLFPEDTLTFTNVIGGVKKCEWPSWSVQRPEEVRWKWLNPSRQICGAPISNTSVLVRPSRSIYIFNMLDSMIQPVHTEWYIQWFILSG